MPNEVIIMLSRKQMRKLIRSVYGANAEYGKQIEQLYRRANRQIQGEISAFINVFRPG